MTQQAGAQAPASSGGPPPAPWDDVVVARPGPGRATRGGVRRAAPVPSAGRQRVGAAASAVVLLVLFAGDLAVALGLPALTSTCADRLCGPALGVGAGAGAAAVAAVAAWLVGDVRRDRGRGLTLCWVAVAVAALPWVFLVPAVRWW